MAEPPIAIELPLFPFPDLVHFPGTELTLELFDPGSLLMIQSLLERPPDRRWIGVVLLRPGWQDLDQREPPVFPIGTQCRLLEVEPLGSGRTRARFEGVRRFELQQELGDRPYRTALVRLLEDPPFPGGERETRQLRERLERRVAQVAKALGDSFPVPATELPQILDQPIDGLVNHLAGKLDLPAQRRLQLLAMPLPDRATEVLGILRSNVKLLELLAPYRHLAAAAEAN